MVRQTFSDRSLAREQQEAKRREREAAEAERRALAEAAAEAAEQAAAARAAEEAAMAKVEPKSEPTSRQQSGEYTVPAPRQPKAANTGEGALPHALTCSSDAP